jgi:hypothetical protein
MVSSTASCVCQSLGASELGVELIALLLGRVVLPVGAVRVTEGTLALILVGAGLQLLDQ